MPLDALGFPGCSLFTSIDALALTTSGTVGLDRGYAFFDLPLPLQPTGRGTLVYGQWLTLDPSVPGGGVTEAHWWRH